MRAMRCLTTLSSPIEFGARVQEAAFPSHPVNVITGSSSGAGVETDTRIISDAMVKKGSQPLTVDLRPGAMGVIGATAVYRANRQDNGLSR